MCEVICVGLIVASLFDFGGSAVEAKKPLVDSAALQQQIQENFNQPHTVLTPVDTTIYEELHARSAASDMVFDAQFAAGDAVFATTASPRVIKALAADKAFQKKVLPLVPAVQPDYAEPLRSSLFDLAAANCATVTKAKQDTCAAKAITSWKQAFEKKQAKS